MRISFVRTVGAPDRIYVRRSTGAEASWAFPTYGERLPHDLVHLVVEAAFDLTDAIWARVDGGLDLARANAQANRAGGAGKYQAAGLAEAPVLLSEALANAGWQDETTTNAVRREVVAAACAALAIGLPPQLTEARLGEVQRVLEALQLKWRAATPKGAIDLELDAAHPAGSFAAWQAALGLSR